MWNKLLGKVVDAAAGVAGKALENRGEKIETEQIAVEIKGKLLDVILTEDAQLRNFMLEYEGRAVDQAPWVRAFRALIRPVVTVVTFVMIFLSFIGSWRGWDISLVGLPSQFWWIAGLVVGFWFGGRAGEHMIEKIQGATNGNNSEHD